MATEKKNKWSISLSVSLALFLFVVSEGQRKQIEPHRLQSFRCSVVWVDSLLLQTVQSRVLVWGDPAGPY